MTLEQALSALKPYRSKIPTEELNFIRSNWGEAEPGIAGGSRSLHRLAAG